MLRNGIFLNNISYNYYRKILMATEIPNIIRSISQWNERTLFLLSPGRHWFMKSIHIGLIMVVYGLILSVLLAITSYFLNWAPEKPDEPNITRSAITSVLFAPIFETSLLALIYKLIRPHLGMIGFALTTAILAALAHTPGSRWQPITAMGAFTIMAYQYGSFRENAGFAQAFWGVVLSHATNNGIFLLLLMTVIYLL